MEIETAKENAAVIYNDPNAIFKDGEFGKLETISSWNLIGRLFEWIKDTQSGGQRSLEANRLVLETLDTLGKNIDKCYYFHMKPAQGMVNIYLFNRSLEQLADKAMQSRLDKIPGAHEKLVEIKKIYQLSLHKLSDEERREIEYLLKYPWNI